MYGVQYMVYYSLDYAYIALIINTISVVSCIYALRPLCLHYGYDTTVWDLTEQYLVGTELLVAPVVYEGASTVEVYIPRLSGAWVHVVGTFVLCYLVTMKKQNSFFFII